MNPRRWPVTRASVGAAVQVEAQRGELAVDDEYVRGDIPLNGSAKAGNLTFDLPHHIGVHAAQSSIDFDVAVVSVGRVSDQLIGPNQASEPMGIDGGARHVFRLVDHHAGQKATAAIQATEPFDEFVIGIAACSCSDDPLGGVEHVRRNHSGKRGVPSNPHLRRIHHPELLQLEGDPVVDVVADVLLVGQYLIDGGARPFPIKVSAYLHAIQPPGNLRFRQSLLNEPLVDQIDDTSLVVGAAVAASGSVGYVGLIVPHLVRLTVGTDNRYVIPFSAIVGGIFVVFADTVARTAIAPRELPVGAITALIGAPLFIYLLKKN